MNYKREVIEGNWFAGSSCMLAILGGISITGVGLYGFDWPKSIPWQLNGLYKFTFFLLSAIFLLTFLGKLFNKTVFFVSVLLTFFISLISGAVWSFAVVIWFLISSSLLGNLVLTKGKIENHSWAIDFLVGAAVYGFAVGIFAHFPINYPGFYGLMLVMPILLRWSFLKAWFSHLFWGPLTSKTKNGMDWINVLIAGFGLVYVVVAFMPEVGHDALVAHLFIPAHLLHRQQWGFDVTTYVWAVIPAFGDWIYSILYLLGGESSARLINVWYIFLITYLIQAFIRWIGTPGQRGAQWGSLLFISSPLVFAEGNSLFIDSIWSAYILAGLLAVSKTVIPSHPTLESKSQYLIIGAIFFGTALATKVLTLIFFPILFIILLLSYKNWIHSIKDIKLFLLAVLILVAVSCSAYIYAWYVTGNPVFPFYNKVFNSPLYPPENFIDSRWNKGLSWDLLYRVIFRSGDYLEAMPGVAGFQWLSIFLPSLVAVFFIKNRRAIYIVVIALVSIGICFYSTAYLRYIFPAFALLCGICGVGIHFISSMGGWQRLTITFIGLATLLLNALFFPAGLSVYEDFPLQTIVGGGNKESYLLNRLPLRRAVSLINELNIDKTPVAIFATPQAAGISSDALYVNWYNPTWGPEVRKISSASSAAELLILKNVNFVIIDSSLKDFDVPLGYVKEATKFIAQYGSVEVRTLDDSFRYQKELILNTHLSGLEGWVFEGDAKYNPVTRSAIVRVSSPMHQTVDVISGAKYKNQLVAKCIVDKCLGRVQINWLDSSSKIIGTNIQVFEATPAWGRHEMIVIAPRGAKKAVIYGTSHTEDVMEINLISMRY
ncbi:hypothetical protein [Polynucleobacter sp. UB-Raua-W9]|uniref:hypothetical protein n=1 Tax=Polynucleobacter sp. UB-Raua-W9 TaxID=1819736 RepID=UPI001BFD4B7D|nr:hypothetical protein [Polynucleobacter sp. UB-Raua-W9]QWD72736.1 hypothetical protein AOC07_01755 [Polynucleobacter sp. UB-Raua-W9]